MNHEVELTKAYRRIRILKLKLEWERHLQTIDNAWMGPQYRYAKKRSLEVEKQLKAMKLTKEEEAL
jgi:hypothetical protein